MLLVSLLAVPNVVVTFNIYSPASVSFTFSIVRTLLVFPSNFVPSLYHWYVTIPSVSSTLLLIVSVLFKLAIFSFGIVAVAGVTSGSTTISPLLSSTWSTVLATNLTSIIQFPSLTSP